jgi:hypothetical protein
MVAGDERQAGETAGGGSLSTAAAKTDPKWDALMLSLLSARTSTGEVGYSVSEIYEAIREVETGRKRKVPVSESRETRNQIVARIRQYYIERTNNVSNVIPFF